MKLQKVENGFFEVADDGYRYMGKLEDVRSHMIKNIGIASGEIDIALTIMRQNAHDTAHFGINRTFVFSTDSYSSKCVRTELKAVVALREEFNFQYRVDPESQETREAFDRLMNLYMSFNAQAALEIVETVEDMAA